MAKKSEKDTTAEIQGTKAAIRNLDSKINKLDHDSLKQLEIIYNQVCVDLLHSLTKWS